MLNLIVKCDDTRVVERHKTENESEQGNTQLPNVRGFPAITLIQCL